MLGHLATLIVYSHLAREGPLRVPDFERETNQTEQFRLRPNREFVSDMDTEQLKHLAILRAVVGYLGEQSQSGWWQSSFFAPHSQAFLAHIVTRTQVLAQCTGMTRAAALVHDERIGVGQVNHLFRLPEDMEQGIHRVLHNPDLCTHITTQTADQSTALAHLDEMAAPTIITGVGPTWIDNNAALHTADSWSLVATHYLHAFRQGAQIYPYFADRTA